MKTGSLQGKVYNFANENRFSAREEAMEYILHVQ
jgi:hypothetical protein